MWQTWRVSTWIWSGETAVVFGTIFFTLLFFPIVIWQIRRYGRFSARRLLGSAAICLYLTALATYTWLPFPPDSAAWCSRHPSYGPQLIPFRFVSDIQRLTAGMGWRQRLTDFSVLQVAFNVALFIPWGIIARRFFHRGIAWATFTGLAISMFIELTQYTGLWFIYPCSYRLADIDDLIVNTTGAFIGAVIAPALLWWMPQARVLVASRLEPRKITVWRRWLGMLIDCGSWIFLSSVAVTALLVVYSAAGLERSGWLWNTLVASTSVGSWFIVFILPTFNGGGSLGHSAVWLYPRWRDREGRLGNGSWWVRILRSCVVSLPLLMTSLAEYSEMYMSVALVAVAVLAVSWFSVLFTPDRRGLSCLLTGAKMTDSREPASEMPAKSSESSEQQ